MASRFYLSNGGDKDAQILKFTRGGRFLMQIGHQGQGKGSNDTANLGAAANMVVDRSTNEPYVADGYVNHRIIVFDATSGAYKRHWGAYGQRPDDRYFATIGEHLPGPFNGAVQNENKPSQYDPNGPPPPQFRIVHAVQISRDGLVYVCDRTNNRLQVFRKDGTFVQEAFIAKNTFYLCASSARLAAPVTGPGSSMARTTWPSTRKVISSSLKRTKGNECRSSRT